MYKTRTVACGTGSAYRFLLSDGCFDNGARTTSTVVETPVSTTVLVVRHALVGHAEILSKMERKAIVLSLFMHESINHTNFWTLPVGALLKHVKSDKPWAL